MSHWSVIVFMVSLVECFSSELSPDLIEYPLAKSLVYSPKNRHAKTLEEAQINQEIFENYQEMRRVSQESIENVQREKLYRGVETDELDLLKEDELNRRYRSPQRPESALGRRRVRSQELRRQKLHSQGLRSHTHHSKRTNLDYYNDHVRM